MKIDSPYGHYYQLHTVTMWVVNINANMSSSFENKLKHHWTTKDFIISKV